MNRTLFIWQFDQLEPLWGSPPYGPKIKQQGFTRVAVKAMDGADWMGAFDKNPDAVNTLQDCIDRVGQFNQAGLAVDYWVNPTEATWQGAVNQYAMIAEKTPGRLILDLEPYQGFWGAEDRNVDAFLAELRHQSQNTPFANGYWTNRVWITYDPRRFNWLNNWYNQFGGSMPQIYDPGWTTYVEPTGKPIEPLLDANGSGQQWLSILRDPVLGSEDGRTGFGIFRAPLVGQERLVTLGGMA